MQKRKSGEGMGTAAGKEQGMYETKGGEVGEWTKGAGATKDAAETVEGKPSAEETVGGRSLRRLAEAVTYFKTCLFCEYLIYWYPCEGQAGIEPVEGVEPPETRAKVRRAIGITVLVLHLHLCTDLLARFNDRAMKRTTACYQKHVLTQPIEANRCTCSIHGLS